MEKFFWMSGQKAKLARMVGIKHQHLSEIIHRKRGVSFHMASKLARASEAILRFGIPVLAWLDNKATDHPAFTGKKTKTKI